jgi:hypothetical protein
LFLIVILLWASPISERSRSCSYTSFIFLCALTNETAFHRQS